MNTIKCHSIILSITLAFTFSFLGCTSTKNIAPRIPDPAASKSINSSPYTQLNYKPIWLILGGIDVKDVDEKHLIHGITGQEVTLCKPWAKTDNSISLKKPGCYRFENADPSSNTLWIQFNFNTGNIIYLKGKGQITNLDIFESVSLPLLPPEDSRNDAERDSFFQTIYDKSASVLVRSKPMGFYNYKSPYKNKRSK